jgi:hypothetical protein
MRGGCSSAAVVEATANSTVADRQTRLSLTRGNKTLAFVPAATTLSGDAGHKVGKRDPWVAERYECKM